MKIELIEGNAFEEITKIPDDSKHLILMDPLFDIDSNNEQLLLENAYRIGDASSSMWHFMDWQHVAETKIAAEKVGWHLLNWIVWARSSPGSNSKTYKNSSEHLLWFVKDKKNYTFNKQFREMRGDQVLPYWNEDGTPKGWFFDEETQERVRYAEVTNTWNYIEGEDNLWYITRPGWSDHEKVDHPMQKPRKLCDRILLTSTDEGDSMIDVFAGSGAFLESAQRLNRNGVGFEMKLNYVKIIRDRLNGIIENKRSKDKAKKENDSIIQSIQETSLFNNAV